jgi:hypothetical protein
LARSALEAFHTGSTQSNKSEAGADIIESPPFAKNKAKAAKGGTPAPQGEYDQTAVYNKQ